MESQDQTASPSTFEPVADVETAPEPNPQVSEWEKAIEKVEEREDIVAAKTSKAEAKAELAEFDESVPLENEPNADEDDELERLMEDLTPIEMYALKFLESSEDRQEQLKQAEVSSIETF